MSDEHAYMGGHAKRMYLLVQRNFMALMNMQMTVRDALNSALDEEMARDDKVFLMGEEVSLNCWRSLYTRHAHPSSGCLASLSFTAQVAQFIYTCAALRRDVFASTSAAPICVCKTCPNSCCT